MLYIFEEISNLSTYQWQTALMLNLRLDFTLHAEGVWEIYVEHILRLFCALFK